MLVLIKNYSVKTIRIFLLKTFVLGFFSLIFSLNLLGNKSSSIDNFPPDVESIIKRGKLRVAMVATDQVPFFFNNNGVLTGTDVELAKGIANSLGVKLEVNREAKSFNDLIPLVASKKVDIVISKLSRTLKRSQEVIFSQPYMTFHQALAVNRVALAKIANTDYEIKKYIKSFTGKIGVIKDSSYINYARLFFPEAEIVQYPTWAEVVEAVVKGEVLAAYRDEFELKKVLRVNPDFNLILKLVVLSDLSDHIAMAFNWRSSSLRDFVNIYLSGVKQKTIGEIFEQHQAILAENKFTFNK